MNNENQYNYTYSAKDRAEIKTNSGEILSERRKQNGTTASFRRKRYKKRNDCVLGSRHYQLFDFRLWYELLYGVGRYTLYGWYSCGHYRTYRGRHILSFVCSYHEKERERLAPEILRLTDELLK